MKVIRRQGLFIDAFVGDWPTNSDRVLQDDGVAASTTTVGDDLSIKGFDFSAVPLAAVVRGIEIVIQGYMSDPGGGSLIQLVGKTSKTGGASYTGSRKTPLLTLSEKTYTVGGPSDLWGTTWTGNDLQYVNGFAIAISTFEKASTPTPTYFCEFAAVTVYYDDVDGITDIPTEPLYLSETVTATITAAAVYERLGLADAPGPTGSAITAWRTSANFANRAGKRQRREGAGVRLHVGPAIFYIGDAPLLQKADGTIETTVPMSMMQPGLIAVGEIERRGDYGEDTEYDTASVRLTNRRFADQSGAGSNAKTLAEWFRGIPRAAKSITIWAFVDAGDGWQSRVLFDGLIENIDFTEDECEVYGIQTGSGPNPCPNLLVDSSSFTYEPGSTAIDTGEEIPGSRGKVVPIGIGRFDITAVKKESSFAAGHPFRFTPGQAGVATDRKVYTNAAVFPALWGALFPMMPTVWAARNFRRIEGQTGPLGYVSFPYQNVFLYGSRSGLPELKVDTGPSRSHLLNMLLPGYEYDNVISLATRGNEHQALQYTTIWTWDKGSDTSFGTPFLRDWTSRNTQSPGQGGQTQELYNQHGAGPMDGLGRLPNEIIGRGWSNGTATNAFGVFLNGGMPAGAPGIKNINFWMGLTQVAAIPLAGLVTEKTRVLAKRTGESGGAAAWPPFLTTEGTGTGKVENPMNCIQLPAMEDVTRINAGGFLAMSPPKSARSLGKMLGVRFCCLWNSTTTTAATMYAFFSFGPRLNRGFGPTATESNWVCDWDSSAVALSDIQYEGKNVQAIKIDITANRCFTSFWMLPLWNPDKKKPNEVVDGTKEVLRKAKEDWTFKSWDVAVDGTSGELFESAWNTMLHVEQSDGGLVDLLAAWLEVVYQSPFESTARGFIHPASGRQVEFIPRPKTPLIIEPGIPAHFEFERGKAPEREPTVVYVTGRGVVTGNTELTGTTNQQIEHPADVANTIIRHYLGADIFSRRADGIEFGGFGSTRVILPGYRGTYVFDKPGTVRDVLDKIASQACSFIREQIDDNGDLVWRMYTEVADPDNEYPELLYRTDGYGFRWDDLIQTSFRVTPTSLQDLSCNIRVRYGFHLPTSQWSNEKYCTDRSNNFTTSGAAYQAALLDVRNGYGIENPVVIDAPDIWDPDSAEVLCKWACDRLRRRRIQVEFETFINATDLVPGHVITFADEIGDRVKWPGETSGEWSSKRFNVTRVFPRRDDRRPWIVKVRAVETIIRAA